MAQALHVLRDTLKRKNGAQFVEQSLKDAQIALYELSDFFHAGRTLFRLFIEGKLMPGDDPRDLAARLIEQTARSAKKK